MISDYYDGLDQIEADNGSPNFIKISPSSIEKFFSKPHEWYREFILNEAPAFTGSTATVLGTIVHHFCEQVGKHLSIR